MVLHRAFQTATACALMLAVSSCTLAAEKNDDEGKKSSGQVVLVTHDSFKLPKDLIAQFKQDTGLSLVVRKSGDAGKLTNKLVLTKDNPTGDVAFGVDNTFASRALQEGVFEEYAASLPPGAESLRVDPSGDPASAQELIPIDQASVCINIDKAWFDNHDQDPPRTLDDLADPAWKDLLVLPGAPTSSPGMAFLLSTIAEYGDDGWQDYWTRLMKNGTKLTAGWSDAYYGDFTAGGGKGKRPIVLSYDSSPAFTVDGNASTTEALLDTCFGQVEYAGVLSGAANPDGARKLIDFLLSKDVQAALPDNMYVFPVDDQVTLPKDWARFAVQPAKRYQVDPETIDQHRSEWLTAWTELTSK